MISKAFRHNIRGEYNLYLSSDGGLFLSIIDPSEWSMEHFGSFKFTIDNTWERC